MNESNSVWMMLPWLLLLTWPIAGPLLVVWIIAHAIRFRNGGNMSWLGIVVLFVLLVLSSPLLVVVAGTKSPLLFLLIMGGAIGYKLYRDNNPQTPACFA